MASSSPEQLWTAPRAAKEWEILFAALANGSVGPGGILINLLGGCDFSGGKLEDSVRIKPPKWEALRRSDFGSSEKTYLVVYIRFVVNRVAFYVPLLEEPHGMNVCDRYLLLGKYCPTSDGIGKSC